MSHNVSSCDPMTRRDFLAASTTSVAGGLLAPASAASAAAHAPAPAPLADAKLIRDLVSANHILASEGIVDGYGHVSVRRTAAPDRYLLSRDIAPALVSADDILEYDLDSNALNGEGRAQYRERFIHGEIYRARPDVQAIVHSHSPAVVPFSISGVALRPVFHMAAFVSQGVPVFDAARDHGIRHLLIQNAELGRALAGKLAMKPAILIRGHGVAVVGASLPMAVGRSVYLEQSARIQTQAVALQGGITYLDSEGADELALNAYPRAWELWERRAAGN
ncbi:MAG TPA: class II aldolase/adducin family protein [Steroidobacteraceae bacterium]|nr:class II aldolase/adducin family protein [Steroidobacteraceae bacterium]